MTVVTSSPSRACVHSAWIVYIAEPSPSRLSTGRSGAATAAPVATGGPQPIEPPVRNSQSCSGAPAVASGSRNEPVTASSTTIAPSGSVAPTAAAKLARSIGPSGTAGRSTAGTAGGSAAAPTASASASSAPSASSSALASPIRFVSGAYNRLGLSGYAKKPTGGCVPTSTRCDSPASVSTATSVRYGSSCGRGREPPRANRAGNVSRITRAPVAAAIRAATRSPASRVTGEPSSSAHGSPERNARAAWTTASSGARGGSVRGSGGAGPGDAPQPASAGRISVAKPPPRAPRRAAGRGGRRPPVGRP